MREDVVANATRVNQGQMGWMATLFVNFARSATRVGDEEMGWESSSFVSMGQPERHAYESSPTRHLIPPQLNSTQPGVDVGP